ncbi:SRPBCC family protein [Streptomyces sp. NPDC014623]|uniref:SRPBCC family protein n=1 Tax=Streptomyces sp. NPDC014623 TaxID=3364875 RepID=UPI0036FA5879
MEHEVFVPVPVSSLRRALGDPARVARCVPGLQQDADASAGPLTGRLKFRADGHTITYRGALTLRPSGGGDSFSVTGEGVEARGTGSVKLTLTIGLTETDGGTTIGFTGTASGDGRIVELDAPVALSAAERLLDRFTQQLVTESLATRDGSPEAGAPVAEPSGEEASGAEASREEPPGAGMESVFDVPVPPSSLDSPADMEFTVPDEPPAEAAHARRTMIGRSTEEVDHAPPRGRYAPVPSPEDGTAGLALRWAAPAAALAIVSAVVVSRALRRRRP